MSKQNKYFTKKRIYSQVLCNDLLAVQECVPFGRVRVSTIVDALRKMEEQKQIAIQQERKKAEKQLFEVINTPPATDRSDEVQLILKQIRANFELEVRELRQVNHQLRTSLEEALMDAAELEEKERASQHMLALKHSKVARLRGGLQRLGSRYRVLDEKFKYLVQTAPTSGQEILRPQYSLQCAVIHNLEYIPKPAMDAIDWTAEHPNIERSPQDDECDVFAAPLPVPTVRCRAAVEGIMFFEDLSSLVNPSVALLMPADTAKALRCLPLYRNQDRLFVAVSEPDDYRILEEIERLLDADIVPVAAEATTILTAIDRLAV